MASANGAALTPDMLAERGTAIDHDRVFTDFDSGRIFEPRDVTPRKLDRMLKSDGKARSIEQALTLPLRGAPHSIQPAAGDSGEAEWLRDALTKPANADGMSTPLELVIAQAISACLYRRAFFEKVFKVGEDGRVTYDKLAFRPPGSCRLLYDKQSGGFRGFSQFVGSENKNADDEGRVEIKPRNAFVFIYGQHRRPIEGLSDLETPYSLFETKQKIRFLWMTFLENLTMPKAIAKDDSDDPESIQAFAKKVATLKGGGVVGIGQSQSVDPFETSNAAAQTFEAAMNYLDSEMTASVLAGMLDLTGAAASGKGSFALSRDASDFFLQSRQAVLQELAAALVSYVLADLVRINFGVRAAVPVFRFGPLLQQNVDAALKLLESLATQERPMVPAEFIDMLVEKVADYLSLDQSRVREAIQKRVQAAPEDPTVRLTTAIGAAHEIIKARELVPT